MGEFMEPSKINIDEQINILEKAKQDILENKESYTCLAITSAIYLICDPSLWKEYNNEDDFIDVEEFIPSHNRYQATKLCESNNIPGPNTTKEESCQYGWWKFNRLNEIQSVNDRDLARSVRVQYLDALINKLKNIDLCGQ